MFPLPPRIPLRKLQTVFSYGNNLEWYTSEAGHETKVKFNYHEKFYENSDIFTNYEVNKVKALANQSLGIK